MASTRRLAILALAAASLAAAGAPPPPLAAQETHRAILVDKLDAELTRLAESFRGVAGIRAVDLVSGETFSVDADLVFPQGSAIKIPLLLELFRRETEAPGFLEQRRTLTDAVRTGGSGVLQYLGDGGTEMSLEDLAVFMIVYSDNTATNLLVDAVGMEAINALMADLDAPHTRFQRKMIRPEASVRGEENLSTPAEAAALMVRIAGCDLPLSPAACARVKEILTLPKGGAFRDPVPASVPVAWKPGGVEGVATAWGIVGLPDRPYVLTVMTNYGGDGDALIRAVQSAVYDHFSRLDRSTDHGVRVPLRVLPESRRQRGSGGGAP